METDSRHQCMIYEGSPSKKLPVLASIIRRRLNEGYRCLYLNSPPMVAGMRSTLAAMNIDVAHEVAHARLVMSSEPVSPDGDFNIGFMLRKLEDSLDQALQDGYTGLWASGDMTWEFGPQKNFSRLLEYELALEEMFGRRKELCGICQYHHDTLPQEAMRQGLLAHHTLVINDTLSRINPRYLNSRPITGLEKATRELDEMIAALCALR